MLGRAALALMAFAIGACGGAADSDPQPRVLTVSAGHALTAIEPGAQGSSAYLMELVYDPVDEHTTIEARTGVDVFLTMLPDTTIDPATLAGSLRGRGLLDVSVEGRRLRARFETEELALASVTGDWMGFELGAYRVRSASAERVVLGSRTGEGIEVIEVIAVPAGEQWRRLIARDVDVVPMNPERDRPQYAGMDSIRLLSLPASYRLAVYVNPSPGPLADQSVRQHVLSMIDAEAIAVESCGSVACLPATGVTSYASVEDAAIPQALRLLVLETDSNTVIAARVLRHQLHRAGMEVEVAEVSLDGIVDAIHRGDFDLALSPFQARDDVGLLRAQASFWGWSDPDLLTAIGAGDLGEIYRLVHAQALMLELFEDRAFAAVDNEWCGGDPTSAVSWEWLADLYPCEERDD